MQYLWQHKLQVRPAMTTVDGCTLQIIDPGRLNADSGPDFFNAKVKINGETWVGNVEIHVRASDWYRHGHDKDRAYNSVVLHVVGVNDCRVRVDDGRLLPQVELPCNPEFMNRLAGVKQSSVTSLPCVTTIKEMPSLYVADWLSSLALQRLDTKVERIESLLTFNAGDWEEAAYITLARALGFSVNSEPFERLARSVPMRYIRKHSNDLRLVEAMLMGQAGLLDAAPEDNPYTQELKREYSFAANKFGLVRPGLQWKMSRMRPANLPHRRVALLARLVTDRSSLLAHILSITSLDDAMKIFNRRLDGYWEHAFTFSATGGSPTTQAPQALSRDSVMSLVINVAAPLLRARGLHLNDFSMMERAVDLLQSLPAEHNRLTAMFDAADLHPANALESQALIELRRSYCEVSKCLYCRIGHRMLSCEAMYQKK